MNAYMSPTQLSELVAADVGGVMRADLEDRTRAQQSAQINSSVNTPSQWDSEACSFYVGILCYVC